MAAEIQTYIFLFSILLLPFYLIRTLFRTYTERTCSVRLPPSPPALPIIGHLHLLGLPPHRYLASLANRYGPLVHLHLGGVQVVAVSSAAIAKEILKTNDLAFASRPISIGADSLTYSTSDFVMAPYGPYWKFMKKLTVTELLSGRKLDIFLPVRREEIRRFLRLVYEKSVAGAFVDVEAELSTMMNNIICRMTMSSRISDSADDAEKCRKLVKELSDLAVKFDLGEFFGIFRVLDLQGHGKKQREILTRFDVIVERILKEREKRVVVGETGEKDILGILWEIYREGKSEVKLTRDHIKAFVLDMFVAGTDTSSGTIQWALAELINHPAVFEKAREEIDSVVGKSRLVEESDIPNLPYLQAIIKETMRLHPTAPLILRQSTQDCTVDGCHIPKNARVFINSWAIGRDPKSWESPFEFRPERFLIPTESTEAPIDVWGQNFELIPFGSGRRVCPGASLALNVIRSTIAAMVQCFDWQLDGSAGKTRVDMEEGPGFTLPMAHPFHCIAISRLNSFTTFP